MCKAEVVNTRNNHMATADKNLQICAKGDLCLDNFSSRQNILLASIETSHATSSTRFSSRKLQLTNDASDESPRLNEMFVNARVDKIERVTHDVKCSVIAWKIGEDVWVLKGKVTTGIYDQIRILRAELHKGQDTQATGNSYGGQLRIKKDVTVWRQIWIYYLGAKESNVKEWYQQCKTKKSDVWKDNLKKEPFTSQEFQAPSG